MKISMFQIAVVTAIARSMTAIKVDFTFPSPSKMLFSPIKMSHNQSDTSQHAINTHGMDSAPLHLEPQQTYQDYFYEKDTIQEEADKVKKIFQRKLSQELNKAKKWTHITPQMEEMARRDAYQILFDSADRNFNRRMEFKEVAILLTCFEMINMPKLKQRFRTMDNDSNGFVDMYEWQIAAPQFMPLKINRPKKIN